MVKQGANPNGRSRRLVDWPARAKMRLVQSLQLTGLSARQSFTKQNDIWATSTVAALGSARNRKREAVSAVISIKFLEPYNGRCISVAYFSRSSIANDRSF
jgi:hypothetical protein